MKPEVKQKQIDAAVAKLHLEPGDALVIDARVFNIDEFRLASAPRETRIFPVLPNIGETVKEAFATVHAKEIETMSKNKLVQMNRAFGLTDEFYLSIIDGIEEDYCRCDEESIGQQKRQDEEGFLKCALHERCDMLRKRIREVVHATIEQ